MVRLCEINQNCLFQQYQIQNIIFMHMDKRVKNLLLMQIFAEDKKKHSNHHNTPLWWTISHSLKSNAIVTHILTVCVE